MPEKLLSVDNLLKAETRNGRLGVKATRAAMQT